MEHFQIAERKRVIFDEDYKTQITGFVVLWEQTVQRPLNLY